MFPRFAIQTSVQLVQIVQEEGRLRMKDNSISFRGVDVTSFGTVARFSYISGVVLEGKERATWQKFPYVEKYKRSTKDALQCYMCD